MPPNVFQTLAREHFLKGFGEDLENRRREPNTLTEAIRKARYVYAELNDPRPTIKRMRKEEGVMLTEVVENDVLIADTPEQLQPLVPSSTSTYADQSPPNSSYKVNHGEIDVINLIVARLNPRSLRITQKTRLTRLVISKTG